MQIVIDIPQKVYDEALSGDGTGAIWAGYVKNGTPLPKGHGQLIDKDKLLDELEKTVKSVDDTNKHFLFWDRAVAHVHLSKPIIDADTTESEDKE